MANEDEIIQRQRVIIAHAQETIRLAEGKEPWRSFAWWHRHNPGVEVTDYAATVADSPSPVRWMPFAVSGTLADVERTDPPTMKARPDKVIRFFERRLEEITATGYAMLDLEVWDEDFDTDEVKREMQIILDTAIDHMPEGTVCGFYQIPHHKPRRRWRYVDLMKNATGIFVSTHTISGEALVEYADHIHQVRDDLPVTCYLWIFDDPKPDQDPGDPPEKDAMWNVQHGGWVTVGQLQQRCRELLAAFDHPQLVIRGGGKYCAQALDIVRGVILDAVESMN
jgi:hypothetical protein